MTCAKALGDAGSTGATQCRFVAPRSLASGSIHWVGACPNAKASGPGMLLRRDAGMPGHAFYGEMRAGVPVIGVIDEDGGYRVGKFAEGDIGSLRALEWQERLAAFNAAITAAKAVRAHYIAQNNAASARHYAQVAAKLEMQIE